MMPDDVTELSADNLPFEVCVIDWSKATDFRTFVHLWALYNPNDQIVFKPGMMVQQPEKIRKCLIQIPPEEVMRQIQENQARQAEAARQEAIRRSGLVVPK